MSGSGRKIMMFLVGMVLFGGLPVLGWGLDDVQGFIAHPARVGFLILVVLLQLATVIWFPRAGQNQGDGKKLVQRQRLAVYLLQILSLVIIIAAPFTDRREMAVLSGADIFRYIGLVLFAAGFMGVNLVEAALGKQFSIQVTIQEDHKLITEGPFRFLRHPRYLGIITFNLGIALIFRSVPALLAVVALLLVLLWRIQDEEALMRQEFGAEWDAYKQRSWHLIPYIY